MRSKVLEETFVCDLCPTSIDDILKNAHGGRIPQNIVHPLRSEEDKKKDEEKGKDKGKGKGKEKEEDKNKKEAKCDKLLCNICAAQLPRRAGPDGKSISDCPFCRSRLSFSKRGRESGAAV